MGTDLDKPLTTAERGAAALEAEGLKTADIARALDVTAATVRTWRKNAMYSVAVEQYGKQAQQDLQPVIDRVRAQLAVGIGEAIETLIDNLHAKDADGEPYYSIQNDSAKALAQHLPHLFGRPGGSGDGGDSPAAAQATVQVNFPEGASLPKAVTATAEEVELADDE